MRQLQENGQWNYLSWFADYNVFSGDDRCIPISMLNKSLSSGTESQLSLRIDTTVILQHPHIDALFLKSLYSSQQMRPQYPDQNACLIPV